MLRQLLLTAVLVAAASACGPRQTDATEAPTTGFAPETTPKVIPITESIAEPTTARAEPTTKRVTEAPATTIEDLPTTGAAAESTNAQPTTGKETDAPPTTPEDIATTVKDDEPTTARAEPTTDRVTEAPSTTVKADPTTVTPTEAQTTPTESPTTTVESTTITTTEATTTQPEPTEPPLTCAKNGDIKAIFLLVDGSGSFKDNWSGVASFIRHFKEHVSRHIPIWFYQWSSLPSYCELYTYYNRNTSWGCYGARDPCMGYPPSYKLCPDTQFVKLPSNWTDEDFESGLKQVYGFNQNGWTHNWVFMQKAIDEWRAAKKTLDLGSNGRALLVQMTDGQSELTDWNAVKAFRDENMKFFGVQVYNKDVSMAPYTPIIEDARKDNVVVTNANTQLNGALVQRIVEGGCTPEHTSQTPPRCAANGTMKGVFIVIDGSRGQVNGSWEKVQPFVKLFKKYVDRELPIWLMQTSSAYSCDLTLYPDCLYYCGYPKGKTSWDCFGDETNCPNTNAPAYSTRCPSKTLELVPPNWNDARFDAVSEEIYGIQQAGHNTPFYSLVGVDNTWKKYKAQQGLDKNTRALVVFVGTGKYEDSVRIVTNAQTNFVEEKLKFIGVQRTPTDYPLSQFKYMMDNAGDIRDIIETAADGSMLDEFLVKQIVRLGCN